MSAPLRRPGRTPGSVNLAVALAVLVVLLPLLLHAATAAPPTSAEFSPNAKQVIKKAPPGQAAAVNGTGGSPSPTPSLSPTAQPSGPTPTPSTTSSPVAESDLKRCVGPAPLRQIEDPQSPPCIAYWKGDNGGATAKGVTRDAVYIAIPTPENADAQYKALFAFFNKRFQLYGRQLIPEFCSTTNSGASDQKTQVADAATSASGCGGKMPKPFASTFYRSNNGRYYLPEMACRYKTIAVGSYSPYDTALLNKCPGYAWQYPMLVDDEFANIGEWMCNRLVGKPAKWAAGTDGSTPGKPLTSLTRKFGLLLEPFTEDDPVLRRDAFAPMLSRLHACGVDVASKDIIQNPVVGTNFDPASAQNTMLQLKNDGVTSVVCMCNFFSFGTLQRASEASRYTPEWITGTFGLNDVNSSFTLGAGPPSQMAHTFGVTFQPPIVNPLQNPYTVALTEGDPKQTPDTTSSVEAKLEVYRALLLIASGIQMAGPNLTPETFRDGLRRAAFPNPITELHAGAVGFKPNGTSMTKDGAEWWWSTSAPGPFSDSGAHRGTVCYLNGRRRFELGGWPKGDAPFFSGACDSGA